MWRIWRNKFSCLKSQSSTLIGLKDGKKADSNVSAGREGWNDDV